MPSDDARHTLQQVRGDPMLGAPGGHDAYVGTVIDGRYLVDGVLGEGGMGVVYAGRHRTLEKRVAVKVLKRELADDREMLERFFNEARAASSIGSPHIVDVADFGMLPDGAAYFVMEYLDGMSLGGLLDREKLIPTPRLLKIARQMALGLSAAHAAGIVHRDLKPDNVMLVRRGTEDEFVKILDFGIAKVTHAATRLTRTGSVFGTPHYMSPEQAAGLTVDSRGDIYALGIILYEMACGKVPFDSDNYMGILTQHMYKAAPAPRTLVVPPNAVSPGLEAIILKCLTKKPEGRYQTADELVADLDVLAGGGSPRAVAELMARSGNFNAPADYFRSSAPAQTVPVLTVHGQYPEAPPSERRTGVLVGVAVGLVLASLMIVGFVARDRRATAQPVPSADPTVLVAATQLQGAPSVLAPPGPAKRVVLVYIEPSDAQVALPTGALANVENGFARISLGEGESLMLSVSRPGFATAQVALGPHSREGEKVSLVPVGKAGLAVKPIAPSSHAPPSASPAHAAASVVPVPPAPTPRPTPPTAPPTATVDVCKADPTGSIYPECKGRRGS